MGLTGLEIYKQLPKKNCGECGPSTCLAFAMSIAVGKANLDACPYVSDVARATLESAVAPPIAKIIVGKGDHSYVLGDETELFRHDKKFYHETAIAFKVSDNISASEICVRLESIKELNFNRVGLQYKVQFIALKNDTGKTDPFKAAVKIICSLVDLPLVLMSEDPDTIKEALKVPGNNRPLIYAATKKNYKEMVELSLDAECPLVVKGNGLEELASLVEKVIKAGQKQIVLDPGTRTTSQAIADFTQIRRLAVKKKFRPFGYPIIAFPAEEDSLAEINQAVAYVAKYASIIVLRNVNKAHILPLLTWRQNLFTDPQLPIRVEEKIYEVGNVNENAPVYVTTNFSLTYYSVEGEIEASRIPGYIIAVDTDGLSVLTAYADGRFEAENIAQVIKKLGIEEKVTHRRVIIPGEVAVISGKLEEESGWKVVIGPREASGIPAFIRKQYG